MNRLRMRVVEALGVVGQAGGEAWSIAEMANLRGIGVCPSFVRRCFSSPDGVSPERFIVTPKLAMQVLHAAASILFLVLVGRGGAVSV